MKRLLLLIPALMLGGCVAVPYDPYGGAVGYPGAVYAAPAPVYVAPYVAPSVYFGFGGGYGYGRGWGGRGWRH
ncbi:hypothetical protein [Herbaspirillum autotrophicum]|jgi:hypothetical protein|uniref:hypothetical protein n=1 Tax=Herbaspirillum autotrophicum TaxID=180195 RepID=UPI00067B4FB5|nr:hypothetical protein [Herbaspirillum autotrophicum]